ncbi:hypothetical protein OAJ30_01110 [Alphaproteobacteria bacterium]|nr:hypothetical protein [Alphaproteobacteria bacterium]
MKTLLTLFVLFFSSSVVADPITYVDDWHLLKQYEKKILEINENDFLIKLYIENNNLILTKSDESFEIFKFNNDKFDIYLVSEEGSNHKVFIFNYSNETLIFANLLASKISFIEAPWDFGSLRAIFHNCNDTPLMLGEIKDNYFLSKYKYKERPSKYQCGYLMNGGRCELIVDPKTNEYNFGDKMIVTNDFKYEGEINSIKHVLDGFPYSSDSDPLQCSIYDKITFN